MSGLRKCWVLIFLILLVIPSLAAYSSGEDSESASCGVNLIFIIDNSGSLDRYELGEMKSVLKGFAKAILPHPETEIAVISFSNTADVVQSFTGDLSEVENAIGSVNRVAAAGSETTMLGPALKEALEECKRSADKDKPCVFVLASDFNFKDSEIAKISAGHLKLYNGVRIITFGAGGISDNDMSSLKGISGKKENWYSGDITNKAENQDYFFGEGGEKLRDELAKTANQGCGAVVKVRKLLNGDPYGGQNFAVYIHGKTQSSKETGDDGWVLFNVNVEGDKETIEVTEFSGLVGDEDYVLDSAECKNSAGETAGTPNKPEHSVDEIEVRTGDVITCEFRNFPKCIDKDKDGYDTCDASNPKGDDRPRDCRDDPANDPVLCSKVKCSIAQFSVCAECINPGAPEICDAGGKNDKKYDNNCNGENNEGCDDDRDKWCDKDMKTSGNPAVCPNGGGDCDDTTSLVNPKAFEFCDGIDNNCDGKVDEPYDRDEDTYTICGTTTDGKDTDETANCKTTEDDPSCDCSDKPNGKDGLARNKDDGKKINPGVKEDCKNGIDDDCDDDIDGDDEDCEIEPVCKLTIDAKDVSGSCELTGSFGEHEAGGYRIEWVSGAWTRTGMIWGAGIRAFSNTGCNGMLGLHYRYFNGKNRIAMSWPHDDGAVFFQDIAESNHKGETTGSFQHKSKTADSKEDLQEIKVGMVDFNTAGNEGTITLRLVGGDCDDKDEPKGEPCKDKPDCTTCKTEEGMDGFCYKEGDKEQCVADKDRDGFIPKGDYKNEEGKKCLGDCSNDPANDANRKRCQDKGSKDKNICNKEDDKGIRVNTGCAVCVNPKAIEVCDRENNDCNQDADGNPLIDEGDDICPEGQVCKNGKCEDEKAVDEDGDGYDTQEPKLPDGAPNPEDTDGKEKDPDDRPAGEDKILNTPDDGKNINPGNQGKDGKPETGGCNNINNDGDKDAAGKPLIDEDAEKKCTISCLGKLDCDLCTTEDGKQGLCLKEECIEDKDNDGFIPEGDYKNEKGKKCLGDCFDGLSAIREHLAKCAAAAMVGGIDCSRAEYSACGKCINPDEREVCGDGVDNDCNKKADCEDTACSQCSPCISSGGANGFCLLYSDGVRTCEVDYDEDRSVSKLGEEYDKNDPKKACLGDCGPREPLETPRNEKESDCKDGLDNDCDGGIDCGDDECLAKECLIVVDGKKISGQCIDTEPAPDGLCAVFENCDELCSFAFPEQYMSGSNQAEEVSKGSCKGKAWCLDMNVKSWADGYTGGWVGRQLGIYRDRACDCRLEKTCETEFRNYDVAMCLSDEDARKLREDINIELVKGVMTCPNGLPCYGYRELSGSCSLSENKPNDCRKCERFLDIGLPIFTTITGKKIYLGSRVWKDDTSDHEECWFCADNTLGTNERFIVPMKVMWPQGCQGTEGTCIDGKCVKITEKTCTLDSDCPSHCSAEGQFVLNFECSFGKCKEKSREDCYKYGWRNVPILGKVFDRKCEDMGEGPQCYTQGIEGQIIRLPRTVYTKVSTYIDDPSKIAKDFADGFFNKVLPYTVGSVIPGAGFVLKKPLRKVIRAGVVYDPDTGKPRQRVIIFDTYLVSLEGKE